MCKLCMRMLAAHTAAAFATESAPKSSLADIIGDDKEAALESRKLMWPLHPRSFDDWAAHIVIKRSALHGYGAFAETYIPKSTLLGHYAGELLTPMEYEQRYPTDESAYVLKLVLRHKDYENKKRKKSKKSKSKSGFVCETSLGTRVPASLSSAAIASLEPLVNVSMLGQEEMRRTGRATKRKQEWYIDAAYVGNWTRYINDPRDSGLAANVAFTSHGCIMSLEDIKPGEELLVDYGPSYNWDHILDSSTPTVIAT